MRIHRGEDDPREECVPGPARADSVLLDKPAGLSSNAALRRPGAWLRADKAAFGSLDPLATGMPPDLLGEPPRLPATTVRGASSTRFTVALGSRTATEIPKVRCGNGGSAAVPISRLPRC